jgi:hypothetical protein
VGSRQFFLEDRVDKRTDNFVLLFDTMYRPSKSVKPFVLPVGYGRNNSSEEKFLVTRPV